MSGPTDAELEKLREDNEKMRQQIEAANSKRAESEAQANNEIEYTQLMAESARLHAELVSAQNAAKVTVVRDGAQGVYDATKTQLESAVAQAEAAEAGPVDPNADNKDKNGGNS